MPRGSVTVVVNKSGKKAYRVRYDVPGASDRSQRQRTFATKRDADAFLATTLAALTEHAYIEPARTSLGNYLAEWVAGLGSSRKPSTIYHYRTASEHRFDAIAHVPICDLRPSHIRRLIDSWNEHGYSPLTQNASFRMLRTAMRDAVRNRQIPSDPTSSIPIPARKQAPPIVWTGANIQRFLAATEGTHNHTLWLTLFLTLARVGEICALYRSDIDPDANTLTIARTLRRDANGRWMIGHDPKSQDSVRAIPIPPDLTERLLALPTHNDPLLFHQPTGAPMTEAYVYYRLKGDIARIGNLPPLTPHGARHSGATWLIEQGTPIKVVSQYLGHADAAFTLRMYVHHDSDARKRAAQSLTQLTRAQTVRISTTTTLETPDAPGETE